MVLKNHKIKSGDNVISYWDSGNTTAKEVVILLAPGASTGEVFAEVIKTIQVDTIRFIAPDFPGRGGSKYFVKGLNAIDTCSYEVLDLIEALKIEQYSILAVSFGTMVVDFLLKKDIGKCKYCTLIAPGQYFTKRQRYFINLVFMPANLPFVSKIYKKLLSQVMTNIKYTDEKTLNMQWKETLKYKIDKNKQHILNGTLVFCKYDDVVDRDSQIDLYLHYPNFKSVTFNYPHPIKKEIMNKAVYKAIHIGYAVRFVMNK